MTCSPSALKYVLALAQVLSRTSSGSAANSVSGSPNIASVQGSSAESTAWNAWIGPSGGVNFQQAEEDFQLQLALALRVAAEAAAVDDPDLSANKRGPLGSARLVPGVSRVESTAYRYWVSGFLANYIPLIVIILLLHTAIVILKLGFKWSMLQRSEDILSTRQSISNMPFYCPVKWSHQSTSTLWISHGSYCLLSVYLSSMHGQCGCCWILVEVKVSD